MAQVFGQYGRHRFWEMVPGLLSWGTIGLSLFAAFFAPIFAITFIIVFDLYWTLRVLYFVIHVIAAYRELKKTRAVDWEAEVGKIAGADRLYHAIFLPTYQESLEILRDTLQHLKDAHFAKEKFLIVMGGESGDEENFRRYQVVLEEEFKDVFGLLMFTVHPRGLPGEIPGKGSNLKWIAGKFREVIDTRKIPYADIIVSAFDVDTVPDPQYFGRLAYLYSTVPDPMHSSYQPLTLFSNNIWYAAAPVRVASFGTVFWLLGELVRPERMWTFSSHSMPWQMLVDVGYHEGDIVSEDSRIFLQGLLRYDGHYRVTPMFLPVHMDAVSGSTLTESLGALYKQQRRWAWGVEHLPYMIEKFKEHPKMAWMTKFKYFFNHVEGMYTWSTAPFLIFILGYLPFLFPTADPSALLANSPFTLEWMMRIANVGVFATATIAFFLLPRRPHRVSKWNWLVMIAQWALLPITFTFFGAIPALDAQTRFMFGKYLGFNVTKKAR